MGLMTSPTPRMDGADGSPSAAGSGEPTSNAYSFFHARIQLASKMTSPSIISPVIGSARSPDIANVDGVVIQRKVQ